MSSRRKRPSAEVLGPGGETRPAAPSRATDTEPAAPRPGRQPADSKPVHGRTRVSVAFAGVVAAVVVFALLLVFILENTETVKINYFGASGNMALGVALLLAAIGGALLVGILGMARIVQLRVRVSRARRRKRL
jgi:uncharacterized integral membrane protein